MCRLLLAAALVGAFALTGTADETPKKAPQRKADPSKKAAVTLKVGDPAPALRADKWLQGDEVKKFESDKVYVVEFWATWCGPCIVMMPHLAELQDQYRDKGVTFIGYTAKDPRNTEEMVAEFVKKRGGKLNYTFAYADDRDSYNDWMRAAGRGGIPCSFVVDKASRIAYIGHPMYLDVVLPKVVAGTWKGEASAAEVAKIEDEVSAVFTALRGSPEDVVDTLQKFESKHQELTQIPYFTGPKLNALVKLGKVNEAREFAESVVKKAGKYDDVMALRNVAGALLTAKGNDLLGLAVKAAENVAELSGDKDGLALISLADAYHAVGEKAKAKEAAQKAVEAAESAQGRLKDLILQRAKKYED